MALSPTIKTDRLVLKPLSGEARNIAAHVAWLNDPDVVKFSEQRHQVHTIKGQTAHTKMVAGSLNIYYWDVYHEVDLIGSVSAEIDIHNSIADVGIMIGEKRAWGRGYGKETWQAACGWLLANKVRKIEAGTMEANTPMLSIFHKTGMFYEGERAQHFLLNGRVAGLIQYGKFK